MRSGKDTQPGTLGRDIAAVGLMTFALLLLASLVYARHQEGPVLQRLAAALELSLGLGAWLIPLAGLAAAAWMGMPSPPPLERRSLLGGGLVYLVLLAMLHLANAAPGSFARQEISAAGGYLGALLANPLAHALGLVGAYIVLVGVMLLGALMLVGSTWHEFLTGLGAVLAVPWRAAQTLRARRRQPAHVLAEPVQVGSSKQSELATPPPVTKTTPRGGDVQTTPSAEQEGRWTEGQPPGRRRLAQPAKTSWQLPPVDLLQPHPDDELSAQDVAHIQQRFTVLEETLRNFGVPAHVRHYEHGPTVTRFEIELEPGVRVSRLTQLQGDLALALAVPGVRIEAPIPNKRAVGLEVPNPVRYVVSLRSVVETAAFWEHPSLLAVALGKDVAGRPVVVDLETMPHLLIAGHTGAGKSMCLHSIIVSLLMRTTPEQVRLILIDPKRVEMTPYDGIPNLYSPVVYTLREAADVLRKTIREMQRRYDRFAVANVANIREYNERLREGELEAEWGLGEEPLPYLVVIIDEMADLMTQARAEFEQSTCRLARLGRATGICVIIATQRPSVNVITGHIKANFAARIALRLPAQHDSRTILDAVGCDKLLGSGDMLLVSSELDKPVRLQGAYVQRSDVEQITNFLRRQREPDYRIIPEVTDEETGELTEEGDVGDELFEAAVRYVVEQQEASVSMLQRRFKIGYARAGRLVDLMERRGIVGPHEGSRPRRVLAGIHNLDQVLAGLRAARMQETQDEKPQTPPSPPPGGKTGQEKPTAEVPA
jgi:S-DNA-T family DNA segregation ATPase FtsK/SpoIIIE